ncbi:DMT family transporter [Serratia sp. UGAL515B_01]|uniref:DMT family transporter n=1 Tax=Serratia sp. UGAL515B_01 TaxID=2986763 RepID=UPI002952BCFB|nr:DMT family transporter [Serratia sp. UGAL515B_01]WON78968.1 DMT family transporter [Serratia sp. UGAL515B_01]
MTENAKRIGIVILLFILVTLTWGTTWMAMKIAVATIPPIFATGLRFLAASPLLLLFSWLTKTPLLFPKGSRLFQLLICLAYFAGPFTLMIYGESYVSSGLASIIFANMPVAVLIVSILLLKERISPTQLLGLVLGVVSLSTILYLESSQTSGTSWQGIAALLAAVIIHAIMYVQCKKRSQKISVLTFNTLPCLGAGFLLLLLGSWVEKIDSAMFSTSSLISVGYLGIVAGVFGILCYFALQQRASAFQASLVFLVFPIIALGVERMVSGTTISQASLWLILPLLLGILLTLTPISTIRTVLRLEPVRT